jgi:hypothetical protein
MFYPYWKGAPVLYIRTFKTISFSAIKTRRYSIFLSLKAKSLKKVNYIKLVRKTIYSIGPFIQLRTRFISENRKFLMIEKQKITRKDIKEEDFYVGDPMDWTHICPQPV